MTQTALILGATSDMALALARTLAKQGYHLILAGRSVEQRLINDQKDLTTRHGISVSLLDFDVTETQNHQSFYDSLNPKPTHVICFVGYLGDHQKALTDFSETQKILTANFNGVVSILNCAVKDLESKNTGMIVGVGSVAGDRGRSSNYIYGAAKAGLEAYLSGLRNRLFHHGVHVLTVKPGFVATKMTENLNLPAPITASAQQAAQDIANAMKSQKNVVYTRWYWRVIMTIIKCIPESVFKRLKL